MTARSRKIGGVIIPNKIYFRIGEVSELVGVKSHVLRYWESEFPDVKPTKSKSGQRLYKRRNVEMFLRIKGLLYDERFTINGARKRLKDLTRGGSREIPEHEAPRQLEAFDATPSEPPASDRHSGDAVGGSKVLVKIRRDLESLLEVINK